MFFHFQATNFFSFHPMQLPFSAFLLTTTCFSSIKPKKNLVEISTHFTFAFTVTTFVYKHFKVTVIFQKRLILSFFFMIFGNIVLPENRRIKIIMYHQKIFQLYVNSKLGYLSQKSNLFITLQSLSQPPNETHYVKVLAVSLSHYFAQSFFPNGLQICYQKSK